MNILPPMPLDEGRLFALAEIGQAIASVATASKGNIAPEVHARLLSSMDVLIFQLATTGYPQAQVRQIEGDNQQLDLFEQDNVTPFPRKPK